MANNFGRVNVSITASTGGLTAGLSSASKQLKGFSSTVGKMSGVMGSLRGSMGMLLPLFGGFATVGGAIAALTSAANAAGALHDLSQELGVAGSDLQVLQQVARETGASQESMTVALRRTTRMVGELGQGTPTAVKAFAQLGLSMRDMDGLSVAQQFSLIAQRISALPPQMQAIAAYDIFGRSGQGMLNFLRQVQQVTPEVERLQRALGISLSKTQLANIESMGDAVSRMAMPMQGFINQLLAGLAPAITTVANLFVEFFAKNSSGFSMASAYADGFTIAIRRITGGLTQLYGWFQVISSGILAFGSVALLAFSGVTDAISTMISAMRRVAENLPGIDVGLASSLRAAENSLNSLSSAAGEEGAIWGDAAAANFTDGIRNMTDPFSAFDREFATVTQQMQQAGAAAGQAAGDGISASIQASTQALKAIVVGTSGGEAFRNSILRGADPRNEGSKDGARTADATERSADRLDEIASNLAGAFNLAEIGV